MVKNWSKVLFLFDRLIVDSFLLYGALILAYYVRMDWYELFNLPAPTTLTPLTFYHDFALKVTLGLVAIMAIKGRYAFQKNTSQFQQLREAFWSFSSGFALVTVLFFFLKFHFFSRLIFGAAWILGILALIASQYLVTALRKWLYRQGIGQRQVLLLGSGKLADQVACLLTKKNEFIVLQQINERSFRYLNKYCRELKPTDVYVATDKLPKSLSVGDLAHITHTHHAQFHYVPDELALDLAAVQVQMFYTTPLLTLRSTSLNGWSLFFKSLADRFLSLIIFIGISPIFAGISMLIWIKNTKAPIIYRSKRVGKNGEDFWCYKFRTMVPEAEKLKKQLLKHNERSGGILFKMKDDPRITKIGTKLRRYSLDELPQLLNIMKGDMSLIGPRPHLPEEVAKYSETEQYLLTIKPGLSGLAQINGHNNLSFSDEMKYELYYLKNWNFWLDLRIFFQTLFIFWRVDNR
jgi:exopolysaccharide biosynthesis polyprenyl glycosylphosphotransferase